MANANKRRGDRAELEVQAMLREHLGVPARRALGAGRKDDVGDIAGVPNTVIQVANHKDVARAVREKPLECEEQRGRSWYGTTGRNGRPFDHAATFIRLRGGDYRVVLTPEQWFALWREAQ
jgi:hypothetical protein